MPSASIAAGSRGPFSILEDAGGITGGLRGGFWAWLYQHLFKLRDRQKAGMGTNSFLGVSIIGRTILTLTLLETRIRAMRGMNLWGLDCRANRSGFALSVDTDDTI